MRKKTLLLPACCIILAFSSCITDPDIGEPANGMLTGFAPVYGPSASQDIQLMGAQPIHDPGKIYIYGPYLLVNERRKGIHIFDNSNPEAPAAIGFIQMLGNTDMAIKDGILYADHLGNLVALSVEDFSTLEEQGRLPLRTFDKGLPPPSGSNFVCYDPSKGYVVEWKPVTQSNFDCYAH